jgi:hypothetical protein
VVAGPLPLRYFIASGEIPIPGLRDGRGGVPLDPLSILYIALSIAALVFAIAVTVALLGVRRNMAQVTQRLDETLRQFEMCSEDLRKTNAAVREVVSGMDRAVGNVAHFTEGIRALRRPVDVAVKILDHSVSPSLINLAGGFAGVKAAASHIFHRGAGKEEGK